MFIIKNVENIVVTISYIYIIIYFLLFNNILTTKDLDGDDKFNKLFYGKYKINNLDRVIDMKIYSEAYIYLNYNCFKYDSIGKFMIYDQNDLNKILKNNITRLHEITNYNGKDMVKYYMRYLTWGYSVKSIDSAGYSTKYLLQNIDNAIYKILNTNHKNVSFYNDCLLINCIIDSIICAQRELNPDNYNFSMFAD